MNSPITVDDEWLANNAAGSLSEAKQFLLDCQAEIRPDVREAFAASEHVAGALLESAPSEALSAEFADQLADRWQRQTLTRSPPQRCRPTPTQIGCRAGWRR